MTLLALLDELDQAIGSGVNAATLRHRLSLIREQAEAVESQLEAAQLRIQQLQSQVEEQQVAPEQTAFDEVAEKMLDQFFDAGRPFAIERVAQSLGLSRSMADYHVDALIAAEMLELSSMQPARAGTLYLLTPQGRAHVVKRKKT